jgi:uracil-DNA glycosylase
VDQDSDELYYTTLQKDGAFDESLDEIEDGKDPSELNEASITAWTPYLEDEIDHVDPDLIIIFGERTLRAILNLYGRADTTIEDIPYREIYVIDKYPVLRFDYWSSIDPPDDTGLETHLAEIVNKQWDDL